MIMKYIDNPEEYAYLYFEIMNEAIVLFLY